MAQFAQVRFCRHPFGTAGGFHGTGCAESVDIADASTRKTGKDMAQTAAVTDSAPKSIGKLIGLESTAFHDILARTLSRMSTEALTLVEALGCYRTHRRAFSDAVAVTDTMRPVWKRLLQFAISGRP